MFRNDFGERGYGNRAGATVNCIRTEFTALVSVCGDEMGSVTVNTKVITSHF